MLDLVLEPLRTRREKTYSAPLATELYVHFAPTGDPAAGEAVMLDAFAAGVSTRSRAHLLDSEHVLPFANLVDGRGTAKRHGIET